MTVSRPAADLRGRWFVHAAIEMVGGAPWRRADWRGHVFVSVLNRRWYYVYPSGYCEPWRPTCDDLAAADWEPGYGLDPQ